MNLLASLNCSNEVHLVVGGNSNIAALRVNSIIASGANPILVQNSPIETFPISLQDLISGGKVTLLQNDFKPEFLTTLGRAEIDGVVDKVFVALNLDQFDTKQEISTLCRRLRIPVNVTDSPELCTFTLLSTYSNGGFQLGVTTSGKGCKLASRIKRELVSKLPTNMGEICDRVGELRKKLQEHDISEIGGDDEDAVTTSRLNSLVKEFNMTVEQKAAQRARFLSQIVEYYPLDKLAHITMDTLAAEYTSRPNQVQEQENKKGTISLVGSGPGSVSMLTLGALQEIHTADLILADKLVPQQVLDLIPQKRTRLFIARKFPGNAERAQQELLTMGLEGLQRGEKVVRLKQGDPYIFGRGGEEYLFFSQQHGFVPQVLPGITSALAAPVYSNIPATHREVADQVLICTGTGRRGALPNLPEFVESRTTVFLMALHRIVDLIPHLITEKKWVADLPVAIVERASCPDQRIIRTTLAKAPAAVEALGSRPPGLFVAGYACGILSPLSNEDWVVEEGHSMTEITGVLQKLASSS
ncbi:hypothetical protein JCM33374_g601 [Metschnikowia sp. JCM 33374]|nr:hypothetical protein JCM33374_g601 [Metschnikowia sp. JCM 33374]